LPMSTPAKRTGAPSRKPPALSKYDRSVILWVNHPPVPLITKIRTASVMLAKRRVSPTRSCDHLSCFWLGKVVCKRQKHDNKRRGISAFESLLRVEKGGECVKTKGPTPRVWSGAKSGNFYLNIARFTLPVNAPHGRCVSVRPSPVSALSSEPASPACWAWS